MVVCAVKIRESGRGCLGITLLLLNLSIAMMGLLLVITGSVIAFLFNQQRDMLKAFNYTKISHFVVFLGLALIAFHLVGAKVCFDCGSFKTRHRVQHFMKIYLILLFVAFFLIIALSIVLSSAIHDLTKGFEKGLKELMEQYDTDKNKKTEIDLMQVKNRCCGSKGYKDWTEISWHADDYIRPELKKKKSRGVPFTCCDVEYMGPCIHDAGGNQRPGYQKDNGKSFYQTGCSEVITLTLRWLLRNLSLWLLLPIWLELVIIITTKYFNTSIQDATENGDEEGPGYGYLMEKCPCSCFEFLETDIHKMKKGKEKKKKKKKKIEIGEDSD
ncbi:photoreceptor outer segment membrane glycoprotein 2-like [Stegodyphus dumicola]|uniref:photoreceptor outer segment membrane glycoprotein 2-like n=1 Tax=Stegodyphus dumicola TaxID=202533 RepID=UPI0015ADEC7E|nr:photoreceptor outer segment membrane glycoprotein 2-like [Stegodyphus dumicola]